MEVGLVQVYRLVTQHEDEVLTSRSTSAGSGVRRSDGIISIVNYYYPGHDYYRLARTQQTVSGGTGER